jgi:hypothetical protein
MAEVTYFVALPFTLGTMALRPANRLNASIRPRWSSAPRHYHASPDIGAVAFSRTGDPATGDFGDAKIIKKFGEVPDDLSAL